MMTSATSCSAACKDDYHDQCDGYCVCTCHTVTIVKFLEARIAEDEAEAQDSIDHAARMMAANPRNYRTDYIWTQRWPGGSSVNTDMRFRPERVLAECRAKRAVMDELIDMAEQIDDAWPSQQRLDLNTIIGLQHMAMVYIDHPDFDGKWL